MHVKIGDKEHHTVAEARGPVDALSEALNKAIARLFPQIADVRLLDFKVRILENKHGTDAIIRVYMNQPMEIQLGSVVLAIILLLQHGNL